MTRLGRIALICLLVAFTGATFGLALLSFARKVDTFSRPGFEYERAGGALLVLGVESGGEAERAGLRPGDRIVTADGAAAASLAKPESTLARAPFPHHLAVLRADSAGVEQIRRIDLEKPSLQLDYPYLFLALVGLLYLVIGLVTVSRESVPAARLFWLLCVCSFAVYVLTPAGPRDGLFRAFLLAEDLFRALLPAILLHLFLIFPRPARRRLPVPLIYLPAAAYLAFDAWLIGHPSAAGVEWFTRSWLIYFGVYGAAVLLRVFTLLRRRHDEAEPEKQVRWVALGVTVGVAPFLLLAVLPRALGYELQWLSTASIVPLALIPLAFAYAILKWRLWDVEIFVREALATTASVLLVGMTFVLLNALLDRTLTDMAEPGKNVVAFGSGLVLASLLVPVKKRITGVLEKIQYHDTYRSRRALLDIARDFAMPRTREDLVREIVRRVQDGLHVVPCSLFLFDTEPPPEGSQRAALAGRLASEEIWHLKGSSFGSSEPPAVMRLHEDGFRTFFALRCAGSLVGALGVGHKDGRVPLSSEDSQLLVAVMAQAGLAYENTRLYGALAERLEEIRSLQRYQESVIRSSSSGIIVLDRENRIHSANPAFAELVGRDEKALQGLALSELLPSLPEASFSDGASERIFEAKCANAVGEERDLRVSISAFQGDPDRKVVLVDDVTDRLRAERAHAERERLASLGVLAAGVAHEVNTPITGLSSYAQMLLADTPPGDPRYAILKKMERQTFRAAHLVNNLLEFARPRAAARVPTDLAQVLKNAAESLETTFGARRLRLEMGGEGGPLTVLADPQELEQVFVNLLANARDVSPDGGLVSCASLRQNGSVRIVIADHGPGVSSDVGGKLFRPFVTTKKSGGTGLGLAISRDIVERHGGTIGLAPRDGGGTEAWVTLPLAETSP
jgi:two-component system NtrC family sensor kinase